MNKLLVLAAAFLFALVPLTSYGQQAAKPIDKGAVVQKILELNNRPKQIILGNPNREVEDAILFLDRVPEYDRTYIRFFTTYALPPEMRNDAVLELSFVMHSLVGTSTDAEGNAGAYYPLALADGEDAIQAFNRVYIKDDDGNITRTSETLWWVDIREYNWTPQAWEAMSREDGYFVEPIVQHDRNSLLRLLSGNAIIRADWFIYHATDAQAQLDNGSKTPIYDTLLYAQSGTPVTLDQWKKNWGLNFEEAEKFGNSAATLVTQSRVVARHNRQMYRYNTHFGWLYETYDVKTQRGRKNYLEALPLNKGKRPERDGGEAFATNALLMQVYTLFDGQEKIVHTADPVLARHANDIIGDVRVNVARSCMDCHAAGPIPSENTLREYLGTIKFAEKADKLRVDREFLSNKFEDGISDDQLRFARALKKINGLTPEENLKKFLNLIRWYNEPVSLEQAAFECGVTPEKYVEKMREVSAYGKLPGGIELLIQKKSQPISRDIWESPSIDGIPGMFQQSMIYLYGLTKITNQQVLVQNVQMLEDTTISAGKDVVYVAKKGEELVFIDQIVYNNVTWFTVKAPNGKIGYVKPNQVLLEPKQ